MSKTVLVTGAKGFLGKNLVTTLERTGGVVVRTFTRSDALTSLPEKLNGVDVVFHLAGVNRPKSGDEFEVGNAGLTRRLADHIRTLDAAPLIVFPSSVQAGRDNAYGRSKFAAEEALFDLHRRIGVPIAIYRLPNLFGKWSRPHYNTVVATFCHQVARGLAIEMSDPDHELELAYVDDVVDRLIRHLSEPFDPKITSYHLEHTFRVTLGRLATLIEELRDTRTTLQLPDLSDALVQRMYATYLSFLPAENFDYPVTLRTDARGWLFELLKSDHFGQMFVSKTKPGVTRGNHSHNTKVEKFCVVSGKAIIRFRHLITQERVEYPVGGSDIRVVDIPPGYTHSIENIGDDEMIVLFWASEVFDPKRPDTYVAPVLESSSASAEKQQY